MTYPTITTEQPRLLPIILRKTALVITWNALAMLWAITLALTFEQTASWAFGVFVGTLGAMTVADLASTEYLQRKYR